MRNIIRTIRNMAVCAAVFISATSCLEKYPQSSIPVQDAMQTFNDAEQHVVGIYASLMSSSLYSGLLTLLPDIQSDLVYAVEGNSNTYGNIWQWKGLSTDSEYEAVYGSLYSVIGNCNFYLDNVDRVKESITDDTELDLLDTYTGEVYAVRALCYSELLKMFCKAYDPATAENEPGVVLRTCYYKKEPVVRASLYDSYAFVIADLKRAEGLLDDDDDTSDNYYMSAAAAQAIHARVALYMQDWDEAIRYSSMLIDDKKDKFALSSTLLSASGQYSDFDALWYFDTGTEVIWRIGFTPTSYGGALGTVFLNYNRDYYYFYPDYVPAQWVLDLYSSNDYRYNAYFADSSVTGISIGYSNGLDWPVLVKYFGNRNFTNSYRLYQVSMPKPLRLAEQYLIRAEAYCRSETQKNFSKAASDLNTLRSKRINSGGSISLSESNWKETISDERVRELYMEGFRLHDLKRWNMGFTRTPQSCSQDEGSSLKIEAGDARFVWPIPQHELEAPGSEIEKNDSNN